jgi:hypothetical protein
MTTPWGFQMTAARLVSLVIDGPDGPTRIDIAVQSHPLDAEDPMRPGDIMLWGTARMVGSRMRCRRPSTVDPSC